MKFTFSLIALMLASVATADGQSRAIFVNGAELRASCTETPHVCAGYITAVADALESFKPPLPSTCRSSAVELQEIVDFAIETLDYSGTDLKRPAINILADAFSAKWPC